MSFLGMGTFEILIILLVAFIFLGPERMIEAARTLGKWTGELRRMGSTVQAEMEDLTNIGDPLSSRPGPTRNSSQESASETPLDQDHPTPFRPQSCRESHILARRCRLRQRQQPDRGRQARPAAATRPAAQPNEPDSVRAMRKAHEFRRRHVFSGTHRRTPPTPDLTRLSP